MTRDEWLSIRAKPSLYRFNLSRARQLCKPGTTRDHGINAAKRASRVGDVADRVRVRRTR